MTTIIIQAMPADQPIPGMISVSMGAPLERFEITGLKEAIDAVQQVHTRLCDNQTQHQVRAICYGKKPRGWNQQRNNLTRDWVQS